MMLDRLAKFRIQAAPKKPRGRRHQINGRGQRRAALQALTAAKLWRGEPIPAPTQAAAAAMAGSTIPYLKAADILLEYGDADLIADVEAGVVPVLTAAASVAKRVRLISAYREANHEDRIALGRAVGATPLFDEAVAPLI